MKAVIPILFWAFGLFSATALAGTPGEIKVGGYLRETTLHGLFGKSRKFSEYHGKPLIINVWASWCGPCRAEMGSLERLSRRFGGKQLNVIGISTDDDASAAAAFITQSKITFENYIDSKLLLENMLGANTIPLTVLVDSRGRVVEKIRGSHEWDDPKIVDWIGQTFRLKMQP